MDAPLALCLPLEMLHHIGDVDVSALDAGFLQRAIEDASGRTDERRARKILFVTGLLTHEHDGSVRGRPRSEHRLGATLPEVATATPSGRLAQRGQRALAGKEVSG